MVIGKFALLLIGTALVVSTVTYGMHRVAKGNRVIKYIPAFLLAVMAIYYYLLSKESFTGFEDIARIIFALMALAGSVGGFLTGVLVDIIIPKYKK